MLYCRLFLFDIKIFDVICADQGIIKRMLYVRIFLQLRSETEVPESPPRPLSETSDVSVEVGGTLGRRRARQLADKTRPLTRYLPIRSSELDLRQHIESAGKINAHINFPF